MGLQNYVNIDFHLISSIEGSERQFMQISFVNFIFIQFIEWIQDTPPSFIGLFGCLISIFYIVLHEQESEIKSNVKKNEKIPNDNYVN